MQVRDERAHSAGSVSSGIVVGKTLTAVPDASLLAAVLPVQLVGEAESGNVIGLAQVVPFY